MAQLARDGLRQVEASISRAEELATELAMRQDSSASSLEPWDAAKLDRLAVKLLPEVGSNLLEVAGGAGPVGPS